jgi:hypothetical protein
MARYGKTSQRAALIIKKKANVGTATAALRRSTLREG